MKKYTAFFVILLNLIFISGNFFPSSAFAYRLVEIEGVSKTEKTFFVRLGKKEGLIENIEATFTNNNLSLVAQAIEVTHEYSVWKVVEKNGIMPFAKGQIVTFNHALEKVWMLDPDNYLTGDERNQLDHQKVADRLRTDWSQLIFAQVSRAVGLSTTVAVSSSDQVDSRSSWQGEVGYARILKNNFQWGGSFRYEREILLSQTVNVPSTRYSLFSHLRYYLLPWDDYPYTYGYIGTAVGMGRTSTEVGPERMQGALYMFPALYVGVEYLFPSGMTIHGEYGVETVYTKEKFNDNGARQDTTGVNHKLSFALNCLLF